MKYKVYTKNLEQDSVIKGVRHFETLKDAMLYVKLKYGIHMSYKKPKGDVRPYYYGSYDDLYACADSQEWQDDHEIIKIRNVETDNMVEFVTFGNAYTYEFMHSREYNFIEEV